MTEAEDNTSLETGRQQPKGGAGKLIAVVVALTLLAILLVPGEKETGKSGAPEATPGERPSLLAGDGQQAGTTLSQISGSADQGPGAAARSLIRELRAQPSPDLERAYRAAQKYRQEGRLDDAYLLYFYAAREGHGPAAMELGRATDPSSFEQNGLLDEPDETQANKWYSLAQRAGVADASAALAELRAAVEQKAAAGDQRARRIVLQWK